MLEYRDFYDIAKYANKEWDGGYSEREIACNAYDYLTDFEYSKTSESCMVYYTIRELIDRLLDDWWNMRKAERENPARYDVYDVAYEDVTFWLKQIFEELNLLYLDFAEKANDGRYTVFVYEFTT